MEAGPSASSAHTAVFFFWKVQPIVGSVQPFVRIKGVVAEGLFVIHLTLSDNTALFSLQIDHFSLFYHYR